MYFPNQNIQSKFVLPWSENGQNFGGDLPYFALKCENLPKWFRQKAECPNEAYFLAKKSYQSELGIQHTDFEIPERPPEERDFDALPHGHIVHVHPRLLVKGKKNCNG